MSAFEDPVRLAQAAAVFRTARARRLAKTAGAVQDAVEQAGQPSAPSMAPRTRRAS